MRLMLLGLLACASEKGSPLDSGSDELAGGSDWEVVAQDIPGGVLLSAWSDGDALRMGGGDLGGGPGMMTHFDGETLCWEANVTERALWWIHGDAPGSWVAVGEAGTVLRSQDGRRTRMDVPPAAPLFGVWLDGDIIWAAGGVVGSGENQGEIWKWDGSEWHAIAVDLPGVLFKVWQGWFVGQAVSYRWTGETLETLETAGRLRTVRGRSADDVWAVGGLTSPTVVHWESDAWAPQDTTGLDQAINGVWTAPDEHIWVAGNYGTTAFWDGSEWQRPDLPLTTDHLHAAWRHAGETWWVGGNLFQVGDNHGTILRHGGAQSIDPPAECTE